MRVAAALFLPVALLVAGCSSNTREAASSAPELPALRSELLAMAARDQDVRSADVESMSAEQQQKWMHEAEGVDAANTGRMKEIVHEHGWPTRAMVGDDGSKSAWLLVQHADHDVDFQERCLSLLGAAAERGEVSKSGLAYLTDRVLRARGRPQRYGTQYEAVTNPDGSVASEDGRIRYLPPVVEDPARLDERRRDMGLEPWGAYEAKMAALQHRPLFDAPRAAPK